MSRLLLKKGQQTKFIDNVRIKSGLSFKQLAIVCDKSQKNLSDWRMEKSTIPHDAAKILSRKFSVAIPKKCLVVSDFWHTSQAGKIGGKKMIEKHGNPGTLEGRRLGGVRSQTVHRNNNTGFVVRKKIYLPPKNSELAEFFGIIMGDGGLTKNQVNIFLSSLTDQEYGQWVVTFIKKLFKFDTSLKLRPRHIIKISIPRTSLVDFLVKNGSCCGNKIKNQITIPDWILKSNKLKRSFIRGLIDTDGCVYLDKHKYNNKIYKNICLDFTSASHNLLEKVYNVLTEFNLSPKKYQKSLKIRRKENVIKYFRYINSHNSKHLNKFNKFINGEVA